MRCATIPAPPRSVVMTSERRNGVSEFSQSVATRSSVMKNVLLWLLGVPLSLLIVLNFAGVL